MKNKAFTLIELLGVILILGLLVIITFPLLLNQIKKSKEKISDTTKLLIIDATKDYMKDNENNYEEINGMTYCISLTTLTENNYLNEKLKDENLKNINTTKKVKITYNNNNFNYEIVNTCTNNVLARNDIEVPIVTQNAGLYKSTTDQDRFIYRGGDEESSKVPNFIWLDENGDNTKTDSELYRIISYEPDGKIKVVRNEKIETDVVFDAENARKNDNNTYCVYTGTQYGCNAWGNTSNTYYNGKTLDDLNQDFYFKYFSSSLTTLDDNTVSGTVTVDSQLNTYLNQTWYNTLGFKNKIDEHYFNVGGINYYNGYTGVEKNLEKEKQEEQIYKWKGKIGLLNITEYVESSTNQTCTSVWSNYTNNPNNEDLRTNNNWPCKYENYNYKSEYHQMSLTASAIDPRFIWVLGSTGMIGNGSTKTTTIKIRPAFYLKSDIKLTGLGTETDPYKIQ